MKSSKVKDLKNRKLFYSVERSRLINKFIFINLQNKVLLTQKEKQNILFKNFRRFNQLKYKVSTKVLNKCLLTNRNAKTYSSYNLSRIKIKEFLSFGVLSGYRKSIW